MLEQERGGITWRTFFEGAVGGCVYVPLHDCDQHSS